jgi:drug/metabolite transporter (DMT)-like permease
MNTPSNNHSTISPYFILCLAIVSVSTASLFIRFTQVEVPSLVIAAYRLSLATLITAAFIRSAHIEEIKHLTKREWLLLALSGLFLACHFAVWITSLNITSVASSVLLVTTTPLWVALLSPFLLAEKINSRTAFFLGIAFLGSVIVTFGKNYGSLQGSITCWMPSASSASDRSLLGNLLALLGAFMAAGYMISGRKLRKTISLVSYTLVVYLISSLFLILICFAFRQPLSGYTPITFLWLFLLALIPQIFGHTAFNWVLGLMPAALVSIALLGEPIGSSILAWLFLKEIPSWVEIIGGGLILLGIIFSTKGMTSAS